MWPASVTLNSGKCLMLQRAPHSQLLPSPQSALCKNPTPSLNQQNGILWMYWSRQGKGIHSCRTWHIIHLTEQQYFFSSSITHKHACTSGMASITKTQCCFQWWAEKVPLHQGRCPGQKPLAGMSMHKRSIDAPIITVLSPNMFNLETNRGD